MNFRYDEKYAAFEVIPLDIAERDEQLLKHIRESVLRKAFLGVAEKSLHENGVNIKTVVHEYDEHAWCGFDSVRKIGALVLVSHPHDYVAKMEMLPMSYDYQSDYNCVWCGALSPKDDKFHSGTCENCGGPKI